MALGFGVGLLLSPVRLAADHQWGRYHWERSANPLALDIGDNLDQAWRSHLNAAVQDWETPPSPYDDVLALNIVAGGSDDDCSPTLGRVEVCNGNFGDNGWLGIAQIWTGRKSHIVQAITIVNDFYYSPTYANGFYDTAAWRQFVVCQEIGHAWGLDHQDEDFDNVNLGTCMDYTSDPDGTASDQLSNERPNAHDFEQLALIYAHLDGAGGGGGGGGGRGRFGGSGVPGVSFELPAQALSHVPGHAQAHWGRLVRANRRGGLFDFAFADGSHLFTFVIWA
jgi:hypothetical protein